jgi:hypothetical protein
MISEFLEYNFGVRSRRQTLGDAVEEVTDVGPAERRPSSELDVRVRMVQRINGAMLFVFLVSFADVIVSPYLRPNTDVPDAVKDIVSGTAGYFLSTIVAFIRKPK